MNANRKGKLSAGISGYFFDSAVSVSLLLVFFTSTTSVFSATLLQDDFTGTTINTSKWVEIDPAGIGGAVGHVQQNGSLSVASSSVPVYGTTALYSVGIFASTSLEISAVMTPVSNQMLGYGDYNFQNAGTKAYMIYLQSGSVLGLAWANTSLLTLTNCGAGTNATYKIAIVAGGFQIYKNGVLLCTINTSVSFTEKMIFLQSDAAASTFDDILVTGPAQTVPDAPTIGTVTGGNAQATVPFTPPASNGGLAITGYTALSSPGGFTGTSSSSPIVVSGLANGTAYTFTVTATNALGASTASSVSNQVTPTLPAAPDQVTGLSVTGVNKQALLDWDTPGAGGDVITDYLVEYKTSATSTWSTFNHSVSTTTKIIVTGLLNDTAYDFRVSAINSGGAGTASITVSATPSAISTIAFVFTGESNSGGVGLNSSATVDELAPRSAVQIENLTSGLFLFENLDIGTNNLRDHAGLESSSSTAHGFELQLANSTEANAFPDNPQVYLIKTGQGGSKVDQWTLGNPTGYWTKFLQRTAAAKTQLPLNRQWVVWLSLGINDSLAPATATSTWKTAMIAHINKIKADLPGAIIIMTEFQSMTSGSVYNGVIRELVAEEANVFSVDTTGAETDGLYHWLYGGLKTVGSSMVTITKNTLGLNFPGIPTNLIATSSSSQVLLSWTAPISNGGTSITDYLIEYKTSSASAWTTFNDGVLTTASTTVTGLLDNTAYDFKVSAVNSSGAGNSVSGTATTTDGTAPALSSILSTPSTTTATITWTTNELSSSIIDYGLTTSYGASTVETDISPRVTSHTVSLTGFVACTTYHYRVRSNDSASNLAVGSDNTFTTTGCTGSATVSAETNSNITSASGGASTLTSGTTGITLDVPVGATGADAIYQIKSLDQTAVFATSGTPSAVTKVGNYAFDLKALTGIGTTVTSFSTPITITLTYQDSDVLGINESSLIIYRYDGSTWSALTGCVVNTTANTVICETSNFSVFSLFGTPSTAVVSSAIGGGITMLDGWSNPPIPPKEGFKIITNYGITTTANRVITLNLNAGSDVKKMAVSLTSDFRDISQENYSPVKQIDLCSKTEGLVKNPTCPDGQYIVYVKFYTQYGIASDILSQKIDLVTTSKFSKPVSIFTKDLRLGSKDKQVKILQQLLNANGHIVALSGPGSVDNETMIFGHATKSALIKFQEANRDKITGLINEKGYAGPITRQFINSLVSSTTQVVPIQEIQSLPSIIFTTLLRKGIRSEDVGRLQRLLTTKPEIYPEGLVTGYFGQSTEKAVQKFQLTYNVVSSESDLGFGLVGPKTRVKLQEVFGNNI